MQEHDEEKEIVKLAEQALRNAFVEACRTGTVLYVENDCIMRKEPNCEPVFVKKLERRSDPPQLDRNKVYRIKKRKIEAP